MENQRVVEAIERVREVDVDLVHAYAQASPQVGVDVIRARLAGFLADHERHARALAEAIVALGGRAPPAAEGFAGFRVPGFQVLIERVGTERALQVLEADERAAVARLEEALRLDLPAATRALLERHLADERRHVSALERSRREALVIPASGPCG